MMLEVPFSIGSKPAANNKNQLVSFSIPFSKSAVYSVDQLVVIDEKNTQLNADFLTTTFWPDNSIKWLRCEFIPQSTQQTPTDYKIIFADKNHSPAQKPRFEISEQTEQFLVNCQQHQFLVNKNQLGFNCLPWYVELFDNNEQLLKQKVTKIQVIEQSAKQFSQQISLTGNFSKNEEVLAEFDAKLTFFNHQSSVQVDFTLRNPKAMLHQGGKWDLGNENSLFFKACNIVFEQTQENQQQTQIKLAPEKNWQGFNNQSLFQASSGGERWQSSNHVGADRKNNLAFQGYKVFDNNKLELAAGLRAQPSVILPIDATKQLAITLENFWQNFPKSITSQANKTIMGLFPQQHHECHELQPGEQKTHHFYLALNEADLSAISSPKQVNVCPKYLASTHVLPFFTNNETSDDIDKLINLGLTHPNNFFEKREQIDEFGWRNFGDLYADHETLSFEGEQELISHYNNQYDPLYGFIRQYLLTKNEKWWQLAQDLAQHVKDIDIYHTDLDKAEYNHGLFWHTDHYLPAETASHRTYSKYQQADAYQDHAGGGGPGGQHCYTTGLMLHYFLTGDDSSKTTVIELAQWISHVYEGSNTVFDNLLKIKNRHIPGYKDVLTGQYPLDRGTGNYIVALLDAYEVSNKQSYLDQASLVIKNTASPAEDLAQRQLDNVEETWFYTVFLQAVARYLHNKEKLEQFDQSFDYARALLLHFADWMTEHEQPYLTKPEILEYPNHTWAAQDIRKANVLYLAGYYADSSEQQTKFWQKADSLYQYVGCELGQEETHYFTRILSILMQNHGIKTYTKNNSFNKKTPQTQAASLSKTDALNSAPNDSTKKQILRVLMRSLSTTSVKKELNWLRKRVKKIDNVLLKVGIKS